MYEQLKAKDRQLSEKDEQMRIKDRQIAEKDKQLDQQQQLTLQAMKDQETLKLELDQAKKKSKQPKRLFARLFGRKIKKLFGLLINLMASFIIYSLVWVVIEVNNGKIKRLYLL